MGEERDFQVIGRTSAQTLHSSLPVYSAEAGHIHASGNDDPLSDVLN